MTFHILARTAEGEHVAMTVHEKQDAAGVKRAIESSGIIFVSVEPDHGVAKAKAQQLNAANGVVAQGCSSCG